MHPINGEIISALDIEAEYRELGVEVTSKAPNNRGWVQCKAISRPNERNPSAGFNVQTGYYRDFGGGGETLGLFDFAAKYGHFPDWREARKHYAKKTGLWRRLPKGDKKHTTDFSPQDAFQFLNWNSLAVIGFLKKHPEISEDALRLCGGRLAKYPPNRDGANIVVAFGCYGPDMLNAPSRGYTCVSATGRPIQVYAGEGVPPRELKKMSRGQSGLVGAHGLEHLAESEIIWKVEGLSDMLALQSIIPVELRDRHVVITNSAGASEIQLPSEVAPIFSDKDVAIIHDSDRPGQDGAQLWIGSLGNGIAGSIRNIVLHDEIAESHGDDLRDWIRSGHTYDDLLDLYRTTPAESASRPIDISGGIGGNPAGLTPEQAILKRLGVMVLGHVQGTSKVMCFSETSGRVFEIPAVDRLRFENVLMHFGEHCKELVNTNNSEPDPTKIHMTQIRHAVSIEGGKRPIKDTNQLGVGIWELSGQLVLVGAGEAAICNQDIRTVRVPAIDNKLLDFGDDDPWFNVDALRKLYKQAQDRDWRMEVMNEAIELFRRWDNWVHPNSPDILAALICCSWVQTVWDFRPSVCITGPTNCGKTTLMQGCVAKMFGEKMALFTSKPTEAGIRQDIGHTAKIIMVDEFEHDKHRQQILSLFRSSTRGTDIVRGTSTQRAARFHLRHIPWVSAIETGLRHAADRNRYIILDLAHIPKGRASKLTLPPVAELRDLGERLMAVAMAVWQAAKRLSAGLTQHAFGEIDRRVIESYGVPCAMLAAVCGISDKAALELMKDVLAGRHFEDQSESDEDTLIQDILESEVPLPRGGRATVSQLLTMSSVEVDGGTPDDVLERVGIKRVVVGAGPGRESLNPDGVFLAPAVIRRVLLNQSHFKELEISQILSRAPGAVMDRRRMGAHRPRGVTIPMASVGIDTGSTSGEDLFN